MLDKGKVIRLLSSGEWSVIRIADFLNADTDVVLRTLDQLAKF